MSQTAAVLSRHQKAALIAPAVEALGWQLIELDSFDTDSLGSFAGERPRFMSPHECALRKAALAAELSGLDIGIGSEGSFSAGPYGLGTYNLELICCVHLSQGWAVTGRFYGPSQAQQWQIQTLSQLDTALASVPAGQHLLLQQGKYLQKALDVSTCRILAREQLAQGELQLSYDLRAHLSPERRQHIALAAQNLAERLQSCCPVCTTPGFWPDTAIAGLPCEDCGAPSTLTKARQACCQRCGHQHTFAVEQHFAKAQYCQWCNP
ncbi:DUF6671 family protein [Rheinheimera fenheensis]|uniref:DUF6671 family protein n=1 Tax=Rheinheimera fenheensis TaxID=3152295 RepID=UPI00325CF501